MAYFDWQPIQVPGGTIYAECGFAAHEALRQRQEWNDFTFRLARLEDQWLQEFQELPQMGRLTPIYFAPETAAVADRISRLRKLALSLNTLLDDLEANKSGSKQETKGTFFISYNHKDKVVADRLVVDLRRSGYEVWRDQENVHVGESIRQTIESGIRQSTFLLVLLSTYSIKSAWVRDEIDMAVSLEKELKRTFLLPIVLEKCEIPLLIRGRLWIDFNDYETGLDNLLTKLPIAGPTSS